MVFLEVGTGHGILQSLALRENGANGDLASVHAHRAAWLLEEGAIPASWLETPRPDEDAVADHHEPDPDDPVRLGTGSDTDHGVVAQRGEGSG